MASGVLLVTEHITRRQNELTLKNNSLTPIALQMKKTYDSNVYVKFLPASVDEKTLKEEFGKVGTVISVKLNSRDGANYKHGYVLFENVQRAQ